MLLAWIRNTSAGTVTGHLDVISEGCSWKSVVVLQVPAWKHDTCTEAMLGPLACCQLALPASSRQVSAVGVRTGQFGGTCPSLPYRVLYSTGVVMPNLNRPGTCVPHVRTCWQGKARFLSGGEKWSVGPGTKPAKRVRTSRSRTLSGLPYDRRSPNARPACR
jgi:hypothetical protein